MIYPMRYGLGFMLGSRRTGIFGKDSAHAFGHVGLSNIFCWADPDRQISVALLNTGKPIAALHVVPLLGLLGEIGRVLPKVEGG